ncbi:MULTISPECIES: hypothetical protein [Arsenophonus]|jgi:hypothetical protein|uniref:hypothetical protein n=1 Tax=Arsenophonus TaxID=637 RepID=UPI00387906DE
MKLILIVVALVMLTSGCSSQWVRNSINAEKFSRTKTFCENQSENAFPVKNEIAQKTNITRHTIFQESKKYQTVLIPVINSYVIDVNKDSRVKLFYSCMKKKGWNQKRDGSKVVFVYIY